MADDVVVVVVDRPLPDPVVDPEEPVEPAVAPLVPVVALVPVVPLVPGW